MENKKSTPTKKNFITPPVKTIFGVFILALAGLLTIAMASYLMNWQQDQSQMGQMLNKEIQSSNMLGKLGDWIGNLLVFNSIGITAFVIPFLLLVWGSRIFGIKFFHPWRTISHSLFFVCWLPIFIGAITKGNGVMSGVFGYQIYDYGTSIIGSFGLWAVILLSIIFYFIFEFNISIEGVSQRIDEIRAKFAPTISEEKEQENEEEKEEKIEEEENPTSENPDDVNKIDEEPIITEPEKPIIITPTLPETPEEEEEEEENKNDDDIEIIIEQPKNEPTSGENTAQKLVEAHGLYDHKLDLAKFQLPSIDLLKDYGNENININQDELNENKNRIVGLLKTFNISIDKINATIGPTVTLYEIVPTAGIRVSAIKKLQDDIALNLSALGIRIIAPMPGKGTIGIEVPNKKPSIVSMRSVMSSAKFQNTNMDLPIVFGKTISNDVFMADLAKMPHLLMAGATGQGKSVGINAILASLLYKKHPSELKFVMVDPKKVELSLYSKIERHYLAKLPDTEEAILTDNSKVINTLNSLCVEMDNRYELLKNAFCRNLKEYNQKFTERKLNPENGHRYLPYIVLVVDEFADLIMTAGKEVEHPIARLAQLARAVGIHLIIATQRPSVNVITGMIKANFPARVSFRVNSSIDSRTILDATGADQLIGKGDMLFSNGNDLIRVQCAFIDTPEVEKIAEFIGEQKGYPDAYLLPEFVGEGSGNTTGEFNPNEKDTLFEEAARIVVSSQQGSTSMLQRQLKLGYNRAGRIMDQLEAAGIVGSFNGAKAREVLIADLHTLEQILEGMKQ